MLSWFEKLSSTKDSKETRFFDEFSSSLTVKAKETSTESSIRVMIVGPETKLRKIKVNMYAIFFKEDKSNKN